MTLLFLKYCTCTSHNQQDHSLFPQTCRVYPGYPRTQLLAQFFSKACSSLPHSEAAFSEFLTLSIMLFLSRQAKKPSRPSQHFARWLRSGATKPPSWEGLGASIVAGFSEEEDSDVVENQPMAKDVKSLDWTPVRFYVYYWERQMFKLHSHSIILHHLSRPKVPKALATSAQCYGESETAEA